MNYWGNILVIDSSTSVLKVGLTLNEGDVVSSENADRFSHAENIFRLIENVLSRGGLSRDDIKMIAVNVGPGSFTGLRVGMSTAKGLAVSLDVPISGVSTFEAAAPRLYGECGSSAILVPSRRNEFYLGLVDEAVFDNTQIIVVKAKDIDLRTKGRAILAVDFDPESIDASFERFVSGDKYEFTLEDVVQSAYEKYEKSGGDDLSRLEPLYIQNFPAKVKK